MQCCEGSLGCGGPARLRQVSHGCPVPDRGRPPPHTPPSPFPPLAPSPPSPPSPLPPPTHVHTLPPRPTPTLAHAFLTWTCRVGVLTSLQLAPLSTREMTASATRPEASIRCGSSGRPSGLMPSCFQPLGQERGVLWVARAGEHSTGQEQQGGGAHGGRGGWKEGEEGGATGAEWWDPRRGARLLRWGNTPCKHAQHAQMAGVAGAFGHQLADGDLQVGHLAGGATGILARHCLVQLDRSVCVCLCNSSYTQAGRSSADRGRVGGAWPTIGEGQRGTTRRRGRPAGLLGAPARYFTALYIV